MSGEFCVACEVDTAKSDLSITRVEKSRAGDADTWRCHRVEELRSECCALEGLYRSVSCYCVAMPSVGDRPEWFDAAIATAYDRSLWLVLINSRCSIPVD